MSTLNLSTTSCGAASRDVYKRQWLFRCLSNPFRYMPRYWDARKLYSLMLRYGSSLPDSLKSTPPAGVELATALSTGVSSSNDCIPSPSTSSS